MSTVTQFDSDVYQAGEKELIITDGLNKSTRKVVIMPPGHTGNCFGYGPASPSKSFEFSRALAEAGYAVISIDGGGSATWGGSALLTALDNAVSHSLSVFGGSKVSFFLYSMGGLTLNWIKRNSSKVAGAWLLDPVLDQDWVHNTSGYTPPYTLSPASTAPSGWAAEVESVFSTNSARWAGDIQESNPFGNASTFKKLQIPLRFAHATDDLTVPVEATRTFVKNVNSPLVTLRTGALTGDHVGVFANLPPQEVVDFFNSLKF